MAYSSNVIPWFPGKKYRNESTITVATYIIFLELNLLHSYFQAHRAFRTELASKLPRNDQVQVARYVQIYWKQVYQISVIMPRNASYNLFIPYYQYYEINVCTEQ